jgi:DNA-binding NtrC family response regulator
VRELRNVAQRAFVMASGDVITDEWLPSDAPAAAVESHAAVAPATRAGAAAAAASSITIKLGTSMADAERQLILATLAHFNNHKERTAAVLGVSLKTLYNRLKEYSSDKVDGENAEG